MRRSPQREIIPTNRYNPLAALRVSVAAGLTSILVASFAATFFNGFSHSMPGLDWISTLMIWFASTFMYWFGTSFIFLIPIGAVISHWYTGKRNWLWVLLCMAAGAIIGVDLGLKPGIFIWSETKPYAVSGLCLGGLYAIVEIIMRRIAECHGVYCLSQNASIEPAQGTENQEQTGLCAGRSVSYLMTAFVLFLCSYFLAIVGYKLLYYLLPGHHVFYSLFRMLMYHEQYPESYIGICCAIFALVAAFWISAFSKANTHERLAICIVIIALTVLVSAPLGGMLWHFHDMLAGFWPQHYWVKKFFLRGPIEGWHYAGIILAMSGTYVLPGCIAAYGILALSARVFTQNPFSRTSRL